MGVICDNASNNDAFVDELVQRNPNFHKDNHFRCFAHVVNLAVKAALDVADTEIAVLRRCVKSVRLSSLRLDRLKSLCESMKHFILL